MIWKLITKLFTQLAKSKNINNEARPVATESIMPNGWKVKAITGVDSSKLKIKKKS